MKKLYALLAILIVIYVVFNVSGMAASLDNNNVTDNVTDNVTENLTDNTIYVGASSFPTLDNFNDSYLNDTTTSLVDKDGMSIYVSEIDNSESIENIYNNFIGSTAHTATQTIDQNGVTTYFVYNTGSDSYDADIFFNKNGQNYQISGDGIPLSNSDYFINHCKTIIDTLNITSTS